MIDRKLYSFRQIGVELNINYKKILNYRNQMRLFLPGIVVDGGYFKCFEECIEIILLVDGLRFEEYSFEDIRDILLKRQEIKDDPQLGEWVDECLEKYSHYWIRSANMMCEPVPQFFNGECEPVHVSPSDGCEPVQVCPSDGCEPVQVCPSDRCDPVQVCPSDRCDPVQVCPSDRCDPVQVCPSDGCEPVQVCPDDRCDPVPVFLNTSNLSMTNLNNEPEGGHMNITLPDTPISTDTVWDTQPVNAKELAQEIKEELLKELPPMLESLLQKFATSLGEELSRTLTHSFQKLATENNIAVTAICEAIDDMQNGISNLDRRMTTLERELGQPVEEPFQFYEIDASNLQVSLQTLSFDFTVPGIQSEETADLAEEDPEDADPHNLRPVIESIVHSKPNKEAVLDWVMERRATISPAPSYSALASILDDAKILTLSGRGTWSPGTLRNMVVKREAEENRALELEEEDSAEDGQALDESPEEDDFPRVADLTDDGGVVSDTWLDIEDGTDEEEP
ncbi:hypothetical protein LZ24_03369 [Desulfobotulus alkaliphilus]|uniref:Uncharacterized protein n=1 Tax=Desulfobotulus alkaliphilus TaxID=622671 RepID=A0A562QZM1_9BACT|nr:hypothetical protein [Desulfobotulus alkaliphilus]TWI62261.1 hypothetical protein LZ24_03369 [Desulfobotulus alkaliphilus]